MNADGIGKPFVGEPRAKKEKADGDEEIKYNESVRDDKRIKGCRQASRPFLTANSEQNPDTAATRALQPAPLIALFPPDCHGCRCHPSQSGDGGGDAIYGDYASATS